MTDLDESLPIVHLDLATDVRVRLPRTPAAIYFWFEDHPVGHVWLESPGWTGDMDVLASCNVDPAALKRARSASRPLNIVTVSTSIVICTRDRPEDLRRCLAALSRQSCQADQVLVVDNASRGEAVREIAIAAGVDYVREDRPGLSFARNTGARRATGEIILWTDDDIVLHPCWLERMVAAFDAADIGCVTGLVLPAELETWSQRFFEQYWGFGRGYSQVAFGLDFFAQDRVKGCRAWEIGAGASMAFRRTVFDDLGYFDERLGAGAAGCAEDSEYWHRLLGAGWTCRYEPSAVAFHYHRRDVAGLARQIHSYMRGHTAALLIQFERTGHIGNLRRAAISMPLYYARRATRRIIKGPRDRDRLLRQEVAGYLSGILYYLFTRRRDPGGRPER